MTNDPKPPTPPPPPQPFLPSAYHCPCCRAVVKFQVTPSFSKILVALCAKCGWNFDIEMWRKVLKTEHYKDPAAIEEPPTAENSHA